MTEDIHDLVIAGSGIAGLSAAVYAARADLDPLVLEGDEPGGQLTLTTDVENYLGFPDGVGGMDLVQRGKEQAKQFGAQFEHGRIEDADLDGQPLELSLSNGDTIYTRSLIVATGASARWVGAENEDELMGQGLSTCATCDGAFHRGDDVLVVGGGDSAMEEALFLAKFADSVTVVHRREELRASEIMADRARDHDDVQFRWNTELEAIHGSQAEGVTGATLVSHPEGYPREKAESGSTSSERPSMSAGCSTPSATRRTRGSSRGPASNETRVATSSRRPTTLVGPRPRRPSMGCSLLATLLTPATGRRSRLRAPGAWPLSTPKRSSSRCRTQTNRPLLKPPVRNDP